MKSTAKTFQVIILVGGKGTRFSKKNEPPKHLTNLNNNLILINIINYLKSSGFQYFMFPLGAKKKIFY